MDTIIANKLTFPTFSWLKVNETKIQIPEIPKLETIQPIKKEQKQQIDAFFDFDYGISKQALQLNQNYGNDYYLYTGLKDEVIHFPTKQMKTTADQSVLFDYQDIVAEENSHVQFILDYTSDGVLDSFRHSIIRILAKQNAKVSVFVIQRESARSTSLESIAIKAEEGASVHLSQYHMGASKLYSNYKAILKGADASATVDSIYYGRAEDAIDFSYDMIHQGPRSYSSILVNGVLNDKAHKSFKSNLEFKQGAREAEGSEEEYVLLMNDTAHSISVPLMLCHEDDVQGNHAANVGKVDPEIMFYLMSRGFSEKEAQDLIVESKFASTIHLLGDPDMQESLWQSIRNQIKKGV